MRRLLKSFCGTVGVCLLIALLVALAKLVSLIPLGAIVTFVAGNWPGLLIGVIISYMGMGVSELVGRKKRHHRDEDEE